MQIVIDISDNDYKSITQDYIEYANTTGGRVFKAIKNGTSLPKGHGRLIDADVLEPDRCGEWNGLYVTEDTYKQSTIDKAPTIIEADNESVGT